MGFKSMINQPMPAGPINSPGAAAGAGPGGWHPTVLYMLGLVVAEVLLVAFLTRHLFR